MHFCFDDVGSECLEHGLLELVEEEEIEWEVGVPGDDEEYCVMCWEVCQVVEVCDEVVEIESVQLRHGWDMPWSIVVVFSLEVESFQVVGQVFDDEFWFC